MEIAEWRLSVVLLQLSSCSPYQVSLPISRHTLGILLLSRPVHDLKRYYLQIKCLHDMEIMEKYPPANFTMGYVVMFELIVKLAIIYFFTKNLSVTQPYQTVVINADDPFCFFQVPDVNFQTFLSSVFPSIFILL